MYMKHCAIKCLPRDLRLFRRYLLLPRIEALLSAFACLELRGLRPSSSISVRVIVGILDVAVDAAAVAALDVGGDRPARKGALLERQSKRIVQ